MCSVCNDAQIVYDAEEGKYGRIGEPTEAALSVLVEKLGVPGERDNGGGAAWVRRERFLFWRQPRPDGIGGLWVWFCVGGGFVG